MVEERNTREKDLKGLSRRKFLIGAGALATGVLATGLTGCGSTPAATTVTQPEGTAKGTAAPLPWKYNKLDVDKVRERGYKNYAKYGCMYAASAALLETLVESSGDPWATIPMDMFQYGAAGAYGWGTLCGALNGSMAVVNLASAGHAAIGNELIGWYTLFPFPSNKHESYAHYKNQITTVANSPLCHVSVSTWANEAGAKINEKEKKDRCAKVSGDTAARAAELLNEMLEKGAITTNYAVPTEFSHCMACHNGTSSLLDNEQGKFNCTLCHDDHTTK